MRGQSTNSVLAVLALVLVAAAPGPATPDEGDVAVILPGHEDAARALLAEVEAQTEASAGYAWRGPAIEIGDIHFWLMRDEEVRGELRLMPRAGAEDGISTSSSFAIEPSWATGTRPSEVERTLMRAAVASIQARDEGGFYVERQARPSVDRPAAAGPEPEVVHRRWYAELGVFSVIGLVALGVTLRRPRATAG